jgi:hypothetical protein
MSAQPPAEPPAVPPLSTFVLRFWREWSPDGVRWHGRIEHLQSGQSATFLDVEGLTNIIRGFGIMTDARVPRPADGQIASILEIGPT